MAIRSWERFYEVHALMVAAPGDPDPDPLQRAARTGVPVDLDDQLVEAPAPASSTCHGCGRQARPGVVRLKGGFCGPCRAAA